MTFLLNFYILISIFSLIYAARALYRPGISPDLQKLFIKGHLLYVVSFIFIWALQLLNAYSRLYRSHDEDENMQLIRAPFAFGMAVYVQVESFGDDTSRHMRLTPFQYISFVASMSTGLFMGVIRLFEPYFFFLFKKAFFTLFGQPYTEEQLDEKQNQITDTTNAFLKSSLNIELVHIILKAISEECTKIEDAVSRDCKVLDQDFDHRRKFFLHEIEIKDPKEWRLVDVAKQTDNFKLLEEESSNDDFLIINEDIEIKEIAPKVFAAIRVSDGITNEMIRESLSPENNREMVFKAGEGQGKSGSFFFFSHDRKFIIKTMNTEEFNTFHKIFERYFEHVQKYKNSLITRIYGIYTVKKEKIEPVHCILMGNTICSANDGKLIKYIFDLKGSLINREVEMKKNHKPSSVLKDKNLLDIKVHENILKFSEADQDKIMRMV